MSNHGSNSEKDLRPTVINKTDSKSFGLGFTSKDVETATDGRLQLCEEIGSGGMGTVMRGRDSVLNRDLAIKFLRGSQVGDSEVVERFLEEAQINGQLQHPGIVPVYELGKLNQKIPYIAMKLVDGQTLKQLLLARNSIEQDRSRFLGIFEQICQAMAYAHSRRVIHRDLKPSNVMVGAFGEVQVMDWGIAKVLKEGPAKEKAAKPKSITTVRTQGVSDSDDVSPICTVSGSIIGTPAYMAPEQARGQVDLVNEQSDVFGLGSILCVILTGRPPFCHEEREALYRLAAEGNMASTFVRLDNCGADAELISIAKSCLQAKRKDRPQNAGVVADQMVHYFKSVDERLRRAELSKTKAREKKKRLRVAAALAVSVATTLLLCAGAWIWIQQKQNEVDQVNLAAAETEIKRQTDLAQLEKKSANRESKLREEALEAKRETELMLSDVYMARGLDAGEDGDVGSAVLWFASAAGAAGSDPTREKNNLIRARNWLSQTVAPVGAIKVGTPTGMEFQPYSNQLLVRFTRQDVHATQANQLLSSIQAKIQPLSERFAAVDYAEDLIDRMQGSLNGISVQPMFRIVDWYDESAHPWLSTEHSGLATWSANGVEIAATKGANVVELRDSATGKVNDDFKVPSAVTCLEFDRRGAQIAVAGKDVYVWNRATKEITTLDVKPSSRIYALRFSPDGLKVIAAMENDTALVFALNADQEPVEPTLEVEHCTADRAKGTAASAPCWIDNDRFLAIKSKTEVGLWDTKESKIVKSVETGIAHIFQMELDPTGKQFAIGGKGGPEIRETQNLERVVATMEHRNFVSAFKFGSNGQRFLSASLDNMAQVWSLPEGKPVGERFDHDAGISFVDIDGSDKWFATATVNGLIRVWRFPSSWNKRTMHASDRPMRLNVSPNGSYVIAGAYDGVLPGESWSSNHVQMFLARSGFAIGRRMVSAGKIFDTDFCTDGKSIGTVSEEDGTGKFSIWDIGTGGTWVKSLELPSVPRRLRASPKDNRVAILADEKKLLVVDVDKWRIEYELKIPFNDDNKFAFVRWSPDGESLVVVGEDSFVAVDGSTGMLRSSPVSFARRQGEVPVFKISPDSETLAVAANDQVCFWELETGKRVYGPLKHPRTSPYLGAVADICFSPDGQRLLTACLDKNARVWDWKKAKLVCPPLNHTDEVFSVLFSEDGEYAFTGSRGINCGPHTWDVHTGNKVAPSWESDSKRNDQAIHQLDFAYASGLPFLLAMGNTAPNDEKFVTYQFDYRSILEPTKFDSKDMLTFGELLTAKQVVNRQADTLSIDQWLTNWNEFHQKQPTFGREPISRHLFWQLNRALNLINYTSADYALSQLDLLDEYIANEPKLPELNRATVLCLIGVHRAEIYAGLKDVEKIKSSLDAIDSKMVYLATEHMDDLFVVDSLNTLIVGSHIQRKKGLFSEEQLKLDKMRRDLGLWGRSQVSAAFMIEGKMALAEKLVIDDQLPELPEARKLLLESLIHMKTGKTALARERSLEAFQLIDAETPKSIQIVASELLHKVYPDAGERLAILKKTNWQTELAKHESEDQIRSAEKPEDKEIK